VPAPQLVQVDADAAEYVATRQDEHADEDDAEYVPAAQTPVTAERPVVAQYDPPGHAVHALEPVLAKNVPVEQLVQTVAEAIEYLPTAQASVTAERPVVAQYDPPGHAVQAVEPVVVTYVPAKQLEQLEEEAEAE
jgi:hypothetical protein